MVRKSTHDLSHITCPPYVYATLDFCMLLEHAKIISTLGPFILLILIGIFCP